jgi:5-methylcytosine-specific restriction endonuclease McrA
MRLCKDCGKRPRLKMKIKRNSEYFPRCALCQRHWNKLAAQRRRAAARREQLKHNNTLVQTGWCICSNCFKKKVLSEFATRHGKLGGKRHKMCDTCLSRSLMNNRRFTKQFTPTFWRVRAYGCNTGARARLRRLTGKIIPLDELKFIVKPQHLIRRYIAQAGKCYYCDTPLTVTNLACEHSKPLGRLGAHHILNIRLACADCNNLKHKRTEQEFRSFLRVYAERILKVLELRDKEPVR